MLRKPKTHRHRFENAADQKHQSIFFQEIVQIKTPLLCKSILFCVLESKIEL